ncbi:hypothetical protein HK405_003353 [Cladochytrium tenue]|nr:hypothetical protein HK405_003353 [Cladochytrium tenue]
MAPPSFTRRFSGACKEHLPDPSTLSFLEPYEFLAAYERYCASYDKLDSAYKKILHLENYLLDAALSWYVDAASEFENLDWSEFRKLFLEAFGPEDLETTIEQCHFRIRQGESESAFLYGTRFSRLISYLPAARRRILPRGGLEYYLTGLTMKHNMQIEVRYREPANLNTAMKLAVTLEKHQHRSEASTQLPAGGPLLTGLPSADPAQDANLKELEKLIDDDASDGAGSA